jgi:hypothetical protein
VRRKIKFVPSAERQYAALEKTPALAGVLEQVRKCLGYLESNARHPGLQSHEFTSLTGANGEKIFEAYAQNNTPGAHRIFRHYGPDEVRGKKRIPVITVVAITPHP